MVAMATTLHARKWRPSAAYNCYIIYSVLSGSGQSESGTYKYDMMWMLQCNDSFMTPAFLSVSHRNKIHLTHNEHKTAYLPTVNVYGDGSIVRQ